MTPSQQKALRKLLEAIFLMGVTPEDIKNELKHLDHFITDRLMIDMFNMGDNEDRDQDTEASGAALDYPGDNDDVHAEQQ